jgi:hypothetical protein
MHDISYLKTKKLKENFMVFHHPNLFPTLSISRLVNTDTNALVKLRYNVTLSGFVARLEIVITTFQI